MVPPLADGRFPDTSAPIGILIVDDEDAIRKLLVCSLQADGYRVWAASSVQEALQIYQMWQEDIALVLTDLMMPGGGGNELLRSLRQLPSNVPVCFMTGYVGEYTQEDLLQSGAALVIEKPFSLAKIGALLRTCLPTPGN